MVCHTLLNNQPYKITLTPQASTTLPARTFNWYSSETGGTRLATSNSYTTGAILTQTRIWVSTAFVSNPNCETFRGGLVVEVGGPDNYNYVREEVVLVPDKKTEGDVAALTESGKTVTTSYIDGLGRPMQTVVKRGSPTNKDIITPTFYDHYNRETVKPLPITNDNTGYYQNVLNADGTYKAAISTFYSSSTRPGVATDTHPYANVTYESSPLNRVLKTVAPGSALRSSSTHIGVSKIYSANAGPSSAYNSVYLFKYNSETGSITAGGGYPKDELTMVTTTDEDGNVSYEFTDRRGRVICKKVYVNYTTYASTYYVYDDFGNLAIVLPPEAVVQLVGTN